MDTAKVHELLKNLDEMIALEKQKLQLLHEMRQAWRLRIVLPEVDIKTSISLVNYKVGFTDNWVAQAGDKEFPLTLKQYNYIRGERDDF